MKRNVKKLLFGFMPIFGMLLAGCAFGPKSSSTTSTAPYVPPGGEPEDPGVAEDEITGIHMVRSQDFFMQRDEILDFNVTFDGAGDDSQKGISWTSSNPNVVKITPCQSNLEKSWYCTLTALREGSTTIKARSTYSPSLTATVSITVIDNTAYTYFWQKSNSGATKDDQKQFLDADGFTKTEGQVTFSGMTWSFEFEKAPIKVGGGQALKFGSKNDPFGAIHFEAENTRQISKISVLCSSAAEHIDDGSAHGKSGDVGTSNITIKVGDTTYVDNVSTPKNSNDSSIENGTITGATMIENPMEGKISIDFSPTYYDAETKENSGAIYLKAIIIEYFRGEVDHIAIEEVNEYNNQFFVGTKYNSSGIDVNAYYSVDPSIKVNVNFDSKFTMDNVDDSGRFEEPSDDQTINVSYTYNGKEVTTSYDVKVAPQVKEIVIDGDFDNDKVLLKDAIDYTGLSVKIYSEGSGDTKYLVQTIPLTDPSDNKLSGVFNSNSLPKYASKSLQDGFNVSMYHYLTGLSAQRTFEKDELVVKAVAKIDIIFNEMALYNLIEGTKVPYAGFFEAKITFDNDEESTYAFEELKDQTYYDETSGKTLERYNYINYSPVVVNKSFATNGFEVKVVDTIGSVSGTKKIEADDFVIKYLDSVQLNLTSSFKTTYEESDIYTFEGITVTMNYNDSTHEDISFADMKAMTTIVPKQDKPSDTETKKLFTITAPETVEKSHELGFDITITSILDSSITSTLHIDSGTISVTEIPTKQYTKVKAFNEVVANGTYIFVSIDDSGKNMVVLNGDLDEATFKEDKNYLYYSNNGETIGDSLQIKNGPISRAYLTASIFSETQVRFTHTKSNKYLSLKYGKNNFLQGASAAGTKMELTFDENYNAKFKFNDSGSDYYLRFKEDVKFGSWMLSTSGTFRQVQLYKLVGNVS